jgi:hypothetical protein
VLFLVSLEVLESDTLRVIAAAAKAVQEMEQKLRSRVRRESFAARRASMLTAVGKQKESGSMS